MKTRVRSVLAITCLFVFVMSGIFCIAQFERPVIIADAQTLWPSDRHTMPIAYDSESDLTIMFGGWTENFESLGDTWAYDLNTNSWENMSPTSAPSKRSGHAFAYDAESDRAILFSGHKSGNSSTLENWNETWAYDYNTNTWNDLLPTQMPPPRLSGQMVYDKESDICILFGGICDGGSFYGDTWAYDYNTNNWTDMNPLVSPSSRVAGMAYDIESDRVILFGGGGYDPAWPVLIYTDTWAYDHNSNTWTEMNPADSPSSMGFMAYDVESDECVFHGGCMDWPEVVIVSETWTYDYETNTWTEKSPNPFPAPRSRIAFTYDSESDRAVLYCGGQFINGNAYRIINDLWAYDENADSWKRMYPPPFDIVIIIVIGGSVVIVALVILYLTKWRTRE